jgi:methylenetetrahydrofolate dehydrogenase (NADP+)/methenyltetrahydrofolate cyclohydrolase
MQILNGKSISDQIKLELKGKIELNTEKPCLAIIQIGHDKRSDIYIKYKKLFGEAIGAHIEHVQLEQDITQEEIESILESLNNKRDIHGIIIQLPIPIHLNKDKLLAQINKYKDVDGLSSDKPLYTPATARGVMTLLAAYDIQITGMNAVVVGRSKLVGAPIADCLRNSGAEVIVCHKETFDIPSITKQADIVIVAAGVPNLITKDYVKVGQIIIDVGINSVLNEADLSSHLIGDVEFESVSQIVAAISPVPGGVGPLTVASLFQNLYDAFAHFTR